MDHNYFLSIVPRKVALWSPFPQCFFSMWILFFCRRKKKFFLWLLATLIFPPGDHTPIYSWQLASILLKAFTFLVDRGCFRHVVEECIVDTVFVLKKSLFPEWFLFCFSLKLKTFTFPVVVVSAFFFCWTPFWTQRIMFVLVKILLTSKCMV